MSTRRNAFAVLTLVFLAAGCGHKKEEAAKLDAFPVRTAVVARRDVEDALSVVGSLKARDEATLYSRIAGKLVENLVKEGDPVAKDQPVATVQKDEVGVKYEPAPVPSTLNGIVGRVYLDRGADVTLGTPVALVVDVSSVRARADVPERYAGRVRLGQDVRVEVEAYPGRIFRGRVSKESPVVDPDTRSAPIEVNLDNADGRLRSGMFAKMTIVVASRSGVVAAPKEALIEGPVPAVFVIKDGKAVRRELKLGLVNDSQAEVLDGLRAGEAVAVFGLYGLKDGSPVEVLAPAEAAQ
ncbi:MAG: efflux RND transporter periplasmic adaptor subunit [Elusimicrobiota bacterium]